MCDDWMPTLRLRLTPQEFQELPHHAAYRYDYLEGVAVLSPWPRHGHAVLDLDRLPPVELTHPLRQVTRRDGAVLGDLFTAAFHRVQPFGGLDEPKLRDAAKECLQRTFTGGDGPWVKSASFLAHDAGDPVPLGAALVTLLPGGDPSAPDSYRWYDPPPADLWRRGEGQPHLTWIFVSPWHKGQGIGTTLLHAVAYALRRRGYRSLWTTFLIGNDSSMLWHWRHGFVLAPQRCPSV